MRHSLVVFQSCTSIIPKVPSFLGQMCFFILTLRITDSF